ncbi:hypothetical protein [Pseudobacteriovorax antillogorgiicola]|uniref:Uncharacterized protein n=1 Tax=Pseudobacteriovorax antillogorgiicola TaxID=1513793 RepID=A0A1Y6BBL3_9BACT|nr:hypothetical protein [Pseudobacteriovorax antillogorgiicola]TCS58647.1 hypothetical protein EDD56_102160 [Pseudobacteriovorax antillogorgiicola]SME96441.1 hypothetical protein SAMN06296036_102283 [Pseudobacteriovorax antillogorgiicola]
MRKFALALVVLITSLSGFGSGSDTVFRSLKDYYLTQDLQEAVAYPQLPETLENLDRTVVVVKVDINTYWSIVTPLLCGYRVSADLDDGESIEFRIDRNFNAIVADADDGSLYILSP